MNSQAWSIPNRQFWAGVAAAAMAGLLVATGVPDLLRVRRSSNTAQMITSLQRGDGYASKQMIAGGGGGGQREGDEDDRKTIRTVSMTVLVHNSQHVSEQLEALAKSEGGLVVSAEIYGGNDTSSASLTIRIPADRFEEMKAEIRKLGIRVENEKLEAQDVTRQYVHHAARLRNLRAEEAQYLGILKQARTVKETLEVSDKLNEVRGEIEQQQAEFDVLSKQVETVALSVSLRAEAEAQVFGLRWRPLYQLKLAARQGLEGLGDYAATMASFVFYLPAILLWLVTILIGAALGWRVLRWVGKTLFVPKPKTA